MKTTYSFFTMIHKLLPVDMRDIELRLSSSAYAAAKKEMWLLESATQPHGCEPAEYDMDVVYICGVPVVMDPSLRGFAVEIRSTIPAPAVKPAKSEAALN
jgi:hypothetical protein